MSRMAPKSTNGLPKLHTGNCTMTIFQKLCRESIRLLLQVYYCTSNPDHLNETHRRWCKSVALYRKLVVTQSISGRIEPSLPSRILSKTYTLPNNIEQVFQDLYKNYSGKVLKIVN